MGAHAPLTRSLNLSFIQGSEPSEESGSEDDVPSVRRMLKLQQAESEEASEDEADAKVLKAQNRAEALHDSAAPSDALVEQEVNMLTHVCEALAYAEALSMQHWTQSNASMANHPQASWMSKHPG